MERGMSVTVKAFQGELLRRRVWQDKGEVVLLTYEKEYQRALREGDTAEAAGWPRGDIMEVHSEQKER